MPRHRGSRPGRRAARRLDPQCDPPADAWIDLDWSPRLLTGACELAGVDSRALAALNRALDGDGDGDVDVSVLNHPEATGGSGPPPAALAPGSVAHVASELARLDWDAVRAVIPAVTWWD
ncbi:hypothetical protein ABZ543_18120 [Streptomyces roseifaciens]